MRFSGVRCDRCGRTTPIVNATEAGWHLGGPDDFDVCEVCMIEMDQRATQSEPPLSGAITLDESSTLVPKPTPGDES